MSHSLSCLHWAANHCRKQSHQWPNLFYFRFIISDLKIASEISGNLIIFLQQVCFSTFFSFLKLPEFLSLLSLSWWHCLLFIWEYMKFPVFSRPSYLYLCSPSVLLPWRKCHSSYQGLVRRLGLRSHPLLCKVSVPSVISFLFSCQLFFLNCYKV